MCVCVHVCVCVCVCKERKKFLKKEKKKGKLGSFQVYHFKIVTIHIAITTADWACRLFKLLLLDVSICSPVIVSPCKC